MSDNPRSAGETTAGAGPSPFQNIDVMVEAGNGTAETGVATGAAESPQLGLVLDIPVCLSVELGCAEIALRDVVTLGRGSVIELNRNLGEALDVRVNGMLVGRGEIVVVNEERLGLRFTEVVSQVGGPQNWLRRG
jgi:flagellar motor switch protein FliN/FliY